MGQREDYREHRFIGHELRTEREEKIADIYGELLDIYEVERTGSRRGTRTQPVGSHGWQALVWCVGILLTFVLLSVSLYRRTMVR